MPQFELLSTWEIICSAGARDYLGLAREASESKTRDRFKLEGNRHFLIWIRCDQNDKLSRDIMT
jgi:hypothetical protein